MMANNSQDQRLDYLVEEFKADSGKYKDLQTPDDREGKQRILRSLMNIRMPKKISVDVLLVQNEYLKKRAEEKGIVQLSAIPEIRNGVSVWQGDITRLAADAIVNAANSQMLGCFVPMHACIDKSTHIRITHPSTYICFPERASPRIEGREGDEISLQSLKAVPAV